MWRTERIPEEETILFHVFGDETCQVDHDWMVLGTTGVSDVHVDMARALFLGWKKRMGLQGEIKWEFTDKKNVERFKKLMTVYFELLHDGILQFHSMVIPAKNFDYKAFGNPVPEAAYNRLFHHLLVWKYCSSKAVRKRKYHVLFDERTSLVPWEPFRLAVNKAADRKFRMDHWPFRKVGYENSHLDMMLQMNDLVLGAIGFWRNDKHITMAGSPKHMLARHIKNCAGLNSLKDNPRSERFSMWTIRFNEFKGSRA